MHTDRCGNTRRQKCRAKGNVKEVKMQEFMYRDTANVEPVMHDYTSYNWSHWNSKEKFKKKSGTYTRKTFDRFATADSCTWDITHNTESTAVENLKPERWGHRWFKRSTGKKACDNNNNNNNNCRPCVALVSAAAVRCLVLEWSCWPCPIFMTVY
jgi:hypothetical protein